MLKNIWFSVILLQYNSLIPWIEALVLPEHSDFYQPFANFYQIISDSELFQCSEFLLAGQINFLELKINVFLTVCSSEKSSSEKRSAFAVDTQTHFLPSFCISLELLYYWLTLWPASHHQQAKDHLLVCFTTFETTLVFTFPGFCSSVSAWPT